MLTSARRQISYPNPDRSDRPDVPAHILNLVNALEVDVLFNIGTDAARVAATHQVGGGRLWYSSDTNILWFDDGTTWRQIGNAPLASPAFTGTPTAPTPATSDNSTTLATTAFVKAQGYVTTVFSRSGAITAQAGDYTAAQVTNAADKSSASQQLFAGEVKALDYAVTGLTGATTATRHVGGTASAAPTTGTFSTGDWVVSQTGHVFVCTAGGTPGTWVDAGSVSNVVTSVFTRTGAVVAQTGDYTVAQVTGAAPLASPVFTGDPQAPTPAIGDNDVSIATSAFVRRIMPPGVILPYGGTAAPNGEWLMCDGTAVSRATYAALFAVIGTAYGGGDGSTTFNVPNMQGRVPVGKNTGTFTTLGAVGGAETITLDSTMIPSHNHTGTTDGESNGHYHSYSGTTNGETQDHTHQVSAAGVQGAYNFTRTGTGTGVADVGGYFGATGGVMAYPNTGGRSSQHTHAYSGNTSDVSSDHTHGFTTNNTGGGAAHSNLQPYTVTNYIIKI